MRNIPEWAVMCLGAPISLKREIETGGLIYPVGYSAVLVSIQSGWPDSDQAYATIALDMQDAGWEENVPFEAIEPERH